MLRGKKKEAYVRGSHAPQPPCVFDLDAGRAAGFGRFDGGGPIDGVVGLLRGT